MGVGTGVGVGIGVGATDELSARFMDETEEEATGGLGVGDTDGAAVGRFPFANRIVV